MSKWICFLGTGREYTSAELNHEQELLFYGVHVVAPEALREKMDVRIGKMTKNGESLDTNRKKNE